MYERKNEITELAIHYMDHTQSTLDILITGPPKRYFLMSGITLNQAIKLALLCLVAS